MKRLLIEIGTTGFFEEQQSEFKVRIETNKITKKMIKSIMDSLEDALEQVVLDNES